MEYSFSIPQQFQTVLDNADELNYQNRIKQEFISVYYLVTEALRNYVEAHKADFKNRWQEKGGYEGWVQPIFSEVIRNTLTEKLAEHADVLVTREMYVYGDVHDDKKNDILILIAVNGLLEFCISIEIKAESKNNAQNFLRDVQADLKKQKQGITNLLRPCFASNIILTRSLKGFTASMKLDAEWETVAYLPFKPGDEMWILSCVYDYLFWSKNGIGGHKSMKELDWIEKELGNDWTADEDNWEDCVR
jgi:hypothetical protein